MSENNKIIKLIEERLQVGKKEYGTELNPLDGRDWMKEALEELLDATVYLATKLRQLKKLEETNERKENNS
jgi:hypothetical protein|tara:strand:+ start:157 stop:369 length:213 start_codon:yes stop_codon:yes gene_type:complete